MAALLMDLELGFLNENIEMLMSVELKMTDLVN